MKVLGIALLAIAMLSFGYYGVSQHTVTTKQETAGSSPTQETPAKPTWALILGGLLFVGSAAVLLSASRKEVRKSSRNNSV
jgi:hypothetical protein